MTSWRKLTEFLRASRALTAEWEEAFGALPRTEFTQDRIHYDGEWVDRRTDGARWEELVCSDLPLVTQFCDGGRTPSSSSSMPTVVATMLSHLEAEAEAGMRVLEVGTGTGWTAGLLAHRFGSENVVTIEVDEHLADAARKRLHGAGLDPLVLIKDGTTGNPPGVSSGCGVAGRFDRVHATAAVQRVPWAWLEQTRPGGIVLTPFGTAFCNGALLKLTVAEDGRSASGKFVADVAFMWVRGQQPATGSFDVEIVAHRPSVFDPAEVEERHHAAFAIGLLLPSLLRATVAADYDRFGTGRLEVWDGVSYAHCRLADWDGAHAVAESGPRRLWTEIERAFSWWEDAGRPGLDRFGVTVTRDGQSLWLDDPSNTRPLRAWADGEVG